MPRTSALLSLTFGGIGLQIAVAAGATRQERRRLRTPARDLLGATTTRHRSKDPPPSTLDPTVLRITEGGG